ncbi:hypothetical protein J2848_001110 [Azospirillum lipoferum]|uniref:DUF3053 domain-containing protein n=1 Tax=Azospirillum lipoferum TaxID=193 RepID=A0A5A9GW35_AZOLI|nr:MULTISPECIES: DUF6468 domain-containing protein [Azospirillum]KAA0598533.1 DUF3053 domain-containing protein [Azospirillum lipoferum]MCP1609463.1 hypothetical protein [Azospirillum lipoferum]MDW5535228.1 DUF6468 domain-containing protein [Azospirillum sp. NL1]
MSPLVSIIIDVVMVGLLAATIAYAIILNRQIIALRESRGEMAELIQGLNDAMARAESGVRTLKKTAGDTGEDLQRTVNKAQTLRDELEFMIEAADALANRLGNVGERDGARRDGGNRPVAVAPALASRAPAKAPLVAPRPALRSLPAEDDHDHDDHAPPPARLDAPPRRAAARAEPPAEARDPITRDGESLSRAERELLQAIENAGKGIG